jgi:hypothetical protein
VRFKRRRGARDSFALPQPFATGAHRKFSGQGATLQLLAEALVHAAGIYNQTAPSKVSVAGPGDSSPPRLTLSIKSLGYRFEETSEGALYVSEIDQDGTRAWARIEPQTDSQGRVVCWRERKLSQPAGPTLRTADGLSEEYLLGLFRRKLSAAPDGS